MLNNLKYCKNILFKYSFSRYEIKFLLIYFKISLIINNHLLDYVKEKEN